MQQCSQAYWCLLIFDHHNPIPIFKMANLHYVDPCYSRPLPYILPLLNSFLTHGYVYVVKRITPLCFMQSKPKFLDSATRAGRSSMPSKWNEIQRTVKSKHAVVSLFTRKFLVLIWIIHCRYMSGSQSNDVNLASRILISLKAGNIIWHSCNHLINI